MKYFVKLLKIFCICVILPVNNGESNEECPEGSNKACEPCKAKYLNNQIRLKLNEYPELDSPKLGLAKNFNKLRTELSSALIRKPKPKNACLLADKALTSFNEFLLNYHDVKEKVEELIKKLIDLEKVVRLSTHDEYEAFKLTLQLDDCATIDAAKKQIRLVEIFLKRFTQPSNNNELKVSNKNNNEEQISDKDKTSLTQLLKEVTDNLNKLYDKREKGKDNDDFRKLLNTVIASLEIIKRQSAQGNAKKNSLEELIKALEYKVDKLLNQPPTAAPTASPPAIIQVVTPNPNQVDAHLIESMNAKLRQVLQQYPKNTKTDIRLNQIYNEKHDKLMQVILTPNATWTEYVQAQATIQDFMAFVADFQSISNKLESKISKLKRNEERAVRLDARLRYQQCIEELKNCDSFDVCRRYIEKKCRLGLFNNCCSSNRLYQYNVEPYYDPHMPYYL